MQRDLSKSLEEKILEGDKLETINAFAIGIAHDFNNYMATLLSNITLAKLYIDDPNKILEKLNSIERATLRATGLANQLFTFAKGTAPVKQELFLSQLLVDIVNFTLCGSNVDCNFLIDKDLHMVEIDEGQFSRVLINIVINAVQAMPDGGMIKIMAENVSINEHNRDCFMPLPEGEYVKISIQDEGTGIPKAYILKIFDPFFTSKPKGSGLGLSVSNYIIKNFGGHLNVESVSGVGTTFDIYLPAVAQDADSYP